MMKSFPYPVAKEKIKRVIISADTANEADDPFAIAHALLSPTFSVCAISATYYGRTVHGDSMERSYKKTEDLLSSMNYDPSILYRGEEGPISGNYKLSKGAEKIIEEGLKGKLYILAMGALSDVARAMKEEEKIKENLHIIWTGGGAYPLGGWEYNLFNDREAANYVFHSGADIIQFPKNVYQRLSLPFSSLYINLKRCGNLGSYLFNQLIEHSLEEGPRHSLIRSGDGWILGDNATLLPLLSPTSIELRDEEAPFFDENGKYTYISSDAKIRVAESVDKNYIFSDMFSKFEIGGKVESWNI